MKILKQSDELTKKQLINASGSQAFKAMSDFLAVKAAAIVEDVDGESGEIRNYGYLFTDGGVFAGNSGTMINGIEDVIDLLNEGETVEARAIPRESNSGRTFYTIEVR